MDLLQCVLPMDLPDRLYRPVGPAISANRSLRESPTVWLGCRLAISDQEGWCGGDLP